MKGGEDIMEHEDSLLRLWKLYPESAKKLVEDPLAAGLEAIQEANTPGDWTNMDIAVDMLSFIVNSQQE